MLISDITAELNNRISYSIYKNQHQDPYKAHLYFKAIAEAVGFYWRYYQSDMFDIFTNLIAAPPAVADQLTMAALELYHHRHLDSAISLLDRAGAIAPEKPYIRALAAEFSRETGDRTEARRRSTTLLEEFPELLDAHSCLIMCDVDELFACPLDYYQILDYAHRTLRPRSYVEIGVSTGKSLALTRQGTRAIGIDPIAANVANHFFHSPEAEPQLLAMTSNDFFKAHHSLLPLIGSSVFDMAFIDGLHVFEQALMDFIHLEAMSAPNSVIFIHDCLPVNVLTAERVRQTGFWAGDVWRVIACLKAVRPDLHIVTFPSSPSGLAMITGLDPTSRILAQQFDTIVAHFITVPLPESFAERCELLNVTSASPDEILAALPPLPSASS